MSLYYSYLIKYWFISPYFFDCPFPFVDWGHFKRMPPANGQMREPFVCLWKIKIVNSHGQCQQYMRVRTTPMIVQQYMINKEDNEWIQVGPYCLRDYERGAYKNCIKLIFSPFSNYKSLCILKWLQKSQTINFLQA